MQVLRTPSILPVFPGQGRTMGTGGEKAAVNWSPAPAPAACCAPLWQGFGQSWHYNPSVPPEGLPRDCCGRHRLELLTQSSDPLSDFPRSLCLSVGSWLGSCICPQIPSLWTWLLICFSFSGLPNNTNEE